MRSLVLALALLMPACALAEANSLVNSGFDSNLVGWDNPFGRPVAWSNFDSNGSPQSGSVLVTNNLNPTSGGAMLALSQCFAVVPGQSIRYGGEMFVPSSAPQFSFGSVVLRTYTAPGCFAGLSNNTSVYAFDVNQWVRSIGTTQAGPGVVSAALFIGVAKPSGVTVDVSVWFDDLLLDLDGLFANGFES